MPAPPVGSVAEKVITFGMELFIFIYGADDGNRTHVLSLGSSRSAIKLHPLLFIKNLSDQRQETILPYSHKESFESCLNKTPNIDVNLFLLRHEKKVACAHNL